MFVASSTCRSRTSAWREVMLDSVLLEIIHATCCPQAGDVTGDQDTLTAPFANRAADLARAFAASSSRFLTGAFVTSESTRLRAIAATSLTDRSKTAWLAFDGLVNPLSFLTNCSDDACISSSVAGGSKLNKVRIFRHTIATPRNLILHYSVNADD